MQGVLLGRGNKAKAPSLGKILLGERMMEAYSNADMEGQGTLRSARSDEESHHEFRRA